MKNSDFWLGMIFAVLTMGNCQRSLELGSLTSAIRTSAPTCECRCKP